MAGEVLLVRSIRNHVGETVSKVGVFERTIFELKLEARIETNGRSRITLTTYNM